MATLGVIFPPDLPPEDLRAVARAADESGVPELWLWEDCFAESGVASAAAVLGWTNHLRVGIGLLPVPLRNVAMTAMELATLARLFPGRLVPGVGHGVQDWMGQVGARVASPMGLLAEYTAVLRRLLAGERVSFDGRYVNLDDVELAWPPQPPVPVLVGGEGPRTLKLAAELGDGVIFSGAKTLDEVAASLAALTPQVTDDFQVVAFVAVVDRSPANEMAELVQRYFDVGVTTVALLSVGDDRPPLAEFAHTVGHAVAPQLRLD